MAKKSLAGGGRYAEFRSGLGGFVWQGVVSKVDPGATPPNRPRFLENVRILGGSLVSRKDFNGPGALIPPITKYGVTPTDDVTLKKRLPGYLAHNGMAFAAQDRGWNPVWAAEFNSVGKGKLWWGSVPPLHWNSGGHTWEAPTSGGQFGYIDLDSDPIFNMVATYTNADSWPPSIETFAGSIYIGDFGCLRKVNLIQPPPGRTPADMLSAPGDEIVLEFPGYRATALTEWNGFLWILITDPTDVTNAKLYSYDGFVAVEDHVFTVSGAQGGAVKAYKNTLVVTLAGLGSIEFRDAAGVWDTATAANFDSSPYLNSLAEYKDKLIIMDGVDTIWSWDGATLNSLHTIAPVANPWNGYTTIPAYAYCCAVMNDVLYYGWTDTYNGADDNAIYDVVYTGQPAPGNKLQIGWLTYEFTNAGSLTPGQVRIGADADATYTNLISALHAGGGPSADFYSSFSNGRFGGVVDTGVNTASFTSVEAGVEYNGEVAVVGALANATLTQAQVGLAIGARAKWLLDYTVQPTPGDTVSVGARTYTFRNAYPLVDGDVYIAGTADGTFTNLTCAVNATGGTNDPDTGDYYVESVNPDWLATPYSDYNKVSFRKNDYGVDYTGGVTTSIVTPLTNVEVGIDNVQMHLCLGRYDDDNDNAYKFEDMWNPDGYIFVPYEAVTDVPLPNNDYAISAMAFYKGRLWIAATGVPEGNSFVLTHSIQYTPYDGWFACDSVIIGQDPDTDNNSKMFGRGPGHGLNDFAWQGGPQIFYFRSI